MVVKKSVLALILFVLLAPHGYASAGNENQLVILNVSSGDRLEAAIQLFHERYPAVDVVVKEITDSRQIGTWMMSKDGDVDIVSTIELFLPMTTYQYYAAGAIENLDQYNDIVQYMNVYRTEQFNALMIDGHFIAIPEYINPTAWKVNTSLADKIGISIPKEEWTWNDLEAIGHQVMDYNAQYGTKYYLLLDNPYAPYILRQLNANAIKIAEGKSAFIEEQFLVGIEAWTQIVRSGLVLDNRKVGPLQDPFSDCLFGFDSILDYGEMNDECYIQPPAFTSQSLLHLSANALMLNSNSQHKEEAVYFLSCYFCPEVVGSVPIEVIGPWFQDETHQYSLYAGTEREISSENKQLWLTLLERGTMPMNIGEILRDQWNVLYPKLIEGDITVERFLSECQRRANLMLGE